MKFSNDVARSSIFTVIQLTLAFMASSLALADSRDISIRPGDFPDPSIIRVGQEYWAAATSSAWAPEFPILHSTDLIHWEVTGAVFQKRPEWTSGDFWAPEINYRHGTFYVYFAAHQKGGPICIGVATSKVASGPYVDHGPILCEEVGAIDPAPIQDENGVWYLVWKHDGNSAAQSTPLMAQRLSADGLSLVGEKTELFRNDPNTWEGPLIEGPYLLRHDGWFYLFYSGAACCTIECNYALGVARSKNLLGPWEKNPRNPILAGNDTWKCPGHGSIVEDIEGQDFLLYHAMSTKDSVYVGRQPLIDQVQWFGFDGWPTINDGKGPLNAPALKLTPPERLAMKTFADDFASQSLLPGWQWPQDNEPVVSFVKSGAKSQLLLKPNSDHRTELMTGAVLARSAMSSDYIAEAQVDLKSLTPGTSAGLSAYGNATQALGVSVGDGKISLWRRQGQSFKILLSVKAPQSQKLQFRMVANQGKQFKFWFGGPGLRWTELGTTLDGSYLPPWDLGIRLALTASGGSSPVRFDWMKIVPQERLF